MHGRGARTSHRAKRDHASQQTPQSEWQYGLVRDEPFQAAYAEPHATCRARARSVRGCRALPHATCTNLLRPQASAGGAAGSPLRTPHGEECRAAGRQVGKGNTPSSSFAFHIPTAANNKATLNTTIPGVPTFRSPAVLHRQRIPAGSPSLPRWPSKVLPRCTASAKTMSNLVVRVRTPARMLRLTLSPSCTLADLKRAVGLPAPTSRPPCSRCRGRLRQRQGWLQTISCCRAT